MKVRDASTLRLGQGTLLNLGTSVMGNCPLVLHAKSQERSTNALVEGTNLRGGKNGGNYFACHWVSSLMFSDG